MNKISFRLGLDNGVATIGSIQSDLAGGQLSGKMILDAKGASPQATLKLKVSQFDVGDMWSQFAGENIAEGRADVELDLKGGGRSTRAVMAGLTGHVDAVMHRGRLHSRYAELIKADLLLAVLPGDRQVDPTINCFVGRFDVKAGIAKASVLLLDTAAATVLGQGIVDLAKEQFNLTLTPRPKEISLTNFSVPLDVSGPLSDPSVMPNSEAVALGVAGAVATTVIGPFGLLIPLFSAGGDRNPCPAALAAHGDAPAASSPSKRDEPASSAAEAKAPEPPPAAKSEEGVSGFFKGIGRSLEGLGRSIDRMLNQPEKK